MCICVCMHTAAYVYAYLHISGPILERESIQGLGTSLKLSFLKENIFLNINET